MLWESTGPVEDIPSDAPLHGNIARNRAFRQRHLIHRYLQRLKRSHRSGKGPAAVPWITPEFDVIPRQEGAYAGFYMFTILSTAYTVCLCAQPEPYVFTSERDYVVKFEAKDAKSGSLKVRAAGEI
jgi:hypothetical protein